MKILEKNIFKFLNKQMMVIKRDFKIKNNVIIKRDNRIYSAGRCYKINNNDNLIEINTNLTKPKYFNYFVLLAHEIGHINNRFENCEKAEYNAEKFCFQCIKKYYPEKYKNILNNNIKNWLPYLKKNYNIHYRAFNRLYKRLKRNIK